MAAPAPTPEEQRAWLAQNVASDLTYIWEAMGVTLDRQHALGQNYSNVALFAALADSKQEARTALGRDLGIDPTANAGARAALAAVVAAWQQASDTAEKERSLKAEARAMGLPKPLLQTERQAMRVAVERRLGAMDEREEPSPDYLALKLEEVEGGDLQASSLDEVGCVKDDLHGQLQSSLDAGGRLRIVKEKKKAKMPVNSEELRSKIKIECNTMLMLAARFRNKPWFEELSTKTYQRYVDFLLGDKIFQLQIPKGDGSSQTTSANPSWDLMISFEHKLRKEAYRRASREGKSLNATFEVLADASLKETYFVTPLTLELARRSTASSSTPATGGSYGKWRGNEAANNNNKQRPWAQIRGLDLFTPQHRMEDRCATASTVRLTPAVEIVDGFMCVSFVCRQSTIAMHARNKRARILEVQQARARRPLTDNRWQRVSLGKFGTKLTSLPVQCMFCTFLQVWNVKQMFNTTCRNWPNGTTFVLRACSWTSFVMKDTTSTRRKFGLGFHSNSNRE